jgi:type VI secretion system protein ImpH
MRVWEKGHLPAAHEADPEAAGGTVAVRAVAGVGTAGLRGRAAFPDDVFLEFAALFAARPPTAAGLERVLRGHFGWPVTVEEFVGQWLYLDAENRTVLPTADAPTGRNTQLGRDAVVGRRVWDVRNKVRIRLGPLDFPAFQSLQPGGAARAAMADLARAYVGAEFDLEVNPLLGADAVPPLALDPDEIGGPRLGRTAWVASHGFAGPVADARYAVTV